MIVFAFITWLHTNISSRYVITTNSATYMSSRVSLFWLREEEALWYSGKKVVIPLTICMWDGYLLHIEGRIFTKKIDFSITHPIPKYVNRTRWKGIFVGVWELEFHTDIMYWALVFHLCWWKGQVNTREYSADFLIFLSFFFSFSDGRAELLAQYYCLRAEVYHSKDTEGLLKRKEQNWVILENRTTFSPFLSPFPMVLLQQLCYCLLSG